MKDVLAQCVSVLAYKELERILKLSYINMNVDKVLELMQTILNIQMGLSQNNQVVNRTMLTAMLQKNERSNFLVN